MIVALLEDFSQQEFLQSRAEFLPTFYPTHHIHKVDVIIIAILPAGLAEIPTKILE